MCQKVGEDAERNDQGQSGTAGKTFGSYLTSMKGYQRLVHICIYLCKSGFLHSYYCLVSISCRPRTVCVILSPGMNNIGQLSFLKYPNPFLLFVVRPHPAMLGITLSLGYSGFTLGGAQEGGHALLEFEHKCLSSKASKRGC